MQTQIYITMLQITIFEGNLTFPAFKTRDTHRKTDTEFNLEDILPE